MPGQGWQRLQVWQERVARPEGPRNWKSVSLPWPPARGPPPVAASPFCTSGALRRQARARPLGCRTGGRAYGQGRQPGPHGHGWAGEGWGGWVPQAAMPGKPSP